MKIKLVIVIVFLFTLVGCSSNQNEKREVLQSNSSSEAKNYFVEFTNGVVNNEIIGDNKDFANITGNVQSGSSVYLVDVESGIVHGTSVVKDGSFEIYCNMQGLDGREVIFTNDEDLDFPKVNDITTINNRLDLIFVSNQNVTTQESIVESSVPTETSLKVGEIANFTSGLKTTLISVENSDEQPNGDIEGHLVKIVVSIDNLTDGELNVNAHDFSLYDGERNKADVNAKGFYSESIAKGMKSEATIYFDSKDHGPYTIIFGAATWAE